MCHCHIWCNHVNILILDTLVIHAQYANLLEAISTHIPLTFTCISYIRQFPLSGNSTSFHQDLQNMYPDHMILIFFWNCIPLICEMCWSIDSATLLIKKNFNCWKSLYNVQFIARCSEDGFCICSLDQICDNTSKAPVKHFWINRWSME